MEENAPANEPEDENNTSIMDLPSEIRGQIFQELNQKETLSLRLVCDQWRHDVDDFCDLSVEIDDHKPYLNRLLQLRIKECVIVHFLVPCGNESNTVFKYPTLIRKLEVNTDKISADNLYRIFEECCKTVVDLKIHLSLPLLNMSFPPSLTAVQFHALECLHVNVSTLPAGPFVGPPLIQDVLFAQLLSRSMPVLKEFTVEIRCLGYAQISRFSSLVFIFLTVHLKTLKKLNFDLVTGHGMPIMEERALREVDMGQIDPKALLQMDSLEDLRVINSTAVGVGLWAQFIANQQKLKRLETDILPVPKTLFSQVAAKNWETLVQVDISDLTVWTEDGPEPFDMSVFSPCFSLRKLTLDRNCVQRRLYDCSELINMFNLPERLEELALNYFLILSDELLLLFSSEIGNQLKTLSMTQCGDSNEFGVDGSVLEKLISLPEISFIEISSLNFTQLEETQKLNLILTTFGYPANHSYFQLMKVSPEIQNEFEDLVMEFAP